MLDLGVLDWSMDGIVQSVTFERAILRGAEIGINFVDCRFVACEFIGVTTRERFWGAGNQWTACRFSDAVLIDVISPNNGFDQCNWTRSTLRGYVGFETRFSECAFEDVMLEGFSAKRSTVRGKPFTKPPEYSVLFDRCRFVRPVLKNDRFRDIRFDLCEVDSPVIVNCDFTGATGSPQWWSMLRSTDLFEVFLDEVLRRIELRLGSDSVSYARFSGYVREYRSGETTSRDYSKCLFDPSVPESEMEALDEDFDELERRYRV